jgi:hypothetical protein
MSIRTISCFTYRTSTDSVWTDAEHSVKHFVDALKGRWMHGYGYVLVNGTMPRRKIEAANVAEAVEWFGEMAGTILDEEFGDGPVALVPIPTCDCVVGATRSRTTALAEAAVRHARSRAGVADVLRWDQVMPSARGAGGPRLPTGLVGHLRLVGRLDSSIPHALIDDVVGTGGHVRACAAYLSANGVEVRLAICGARSDPAQVPDPFERRVEELEEFVWSPTLEGES